MNCKPVAVMEDGWSEWIHPSPGFLMECCNCGLVHELQVRIGKDNGEGTPLNEGERRNGRAVIFRMRRATPSAALSPQTLPAPAEVEHHFVGASKPIEVERIRRAIWGYVNAQPEDAATLPVVQFLANRDVFLAEALTLATVAAANDEGVARKAEHARIVEKAKQALRLTQGCMECNADDERRWMDTIRWLEEQA